VEDFVGRGGLERKTLAHDQDAVGDLGDDGEVVGDEKHGESEPFAEIGEEFEDLGLDGDVKGGGGFVCDEKPGTIDDGHGDEDALTLAT